MERESSASVLLTSFPQSIGCCAATGLHTEVLLEVGTSVGIVNKVLQKHEYTS